MIRVMMLAGLLAAGLASPVPAAEPGQAGQNAMTLFKSPACGCCADYARYLTDHGYAVSVVERDDMETVKETLGVPAALRSCHTGTIDGYVVEGHVPLAAIERLLSERPKVKGIASPGMPTGSPGMGGPKEPNPIHTFGPDGTVPFMQF